MKNIQNFKITLLFLALMFFVSCKKDILGIETPVSSTVNIADILFNRGEFEKRLLSKKGYIKLSSSTLFGSTRGGDPNIYATFTDSSGNNLSHGKLFVGTYGLDYDKTVEAYDNSLDYSSGTYLKTLFGGNVIFQLASKSGTGDEVLEKIYIPKKLEVTSPLTYAIDKNATIVWNTDKSNSLGIGIVVTFNPQSFGNEKFAHLKPVVRATQTPDDGSYTFDSNDLADFPVGAKIDFTLTRGNLSEIKGKTGNNYLLYATSITKGTYELK